MENQIYKKLSNGNFYVIAFLVGIVLFYLLSVLAMFAGIMGMEFRSPGFFQSFMDAYLNGNMGVNADLYYGILNVSQMVGELILAGLFVFILKNEFKKDALRFKTEWKSLLGTIVVGFIILLGLSYVLSIIYTVFGIEGTSENQELIETLLNGDYRFFMYLTTLLLAPFVEEILFRKLLFGVIEDKFRWKPIFAILISAVIFASIHGVDVFVFQYLGMALVLCASYSFSKNNIFVPMGIHFLNNLLSVLIYVFYTVA